MFVIEITDGVHSYFFSGWEGSDCGLYCDELSFWRPSSDDFEVYEFDDLSELSIEMDLINETDLEFSVGLPDDFCYDSCVIQTRKIRESHNDY